MKFARSMVLVGLFICMASAQQPTVNQNGVVNSASYATANPPGSLVTIFGTNMASTTLLIASTVPLSTHLKGGSEDVSATVNGTPAPMYYATSTQSSVQVPWGVKAGTATIVVTRNGNASPPQAMQVATFSPGIFTVSQDGKGMAWVINNNDGTVAQPSAGWPFPKIKTRVAKAGDNLFVYATGLGPVASPPKDGASPCPPSGCTSNFSQIAKTTTTPTVLINGTAIPAGNVQFSGLTHFYPGV
jgi:uncharacterized protein (TIGR03437 family)